MTTDYFETMHGFTSATTVYEAAQDDDGRELLVLYVGDYDPSGLFMSEHDLPDRLSEYDADHITVKRIALTSDQVTDLPSFPTADKKKDPRYKWFRANHGDRCWELDAMDPNALRDCVEEAIRELIEPVAWNRCDAINRGTRVVENDPRRLERRVAMSAEGDTAAEQIADLIARLTSTNISRAELMVEIAKQFPGVSYETFLIGLTLFERKRGGMQ
jgi:hypothetical protein